MCSYNSSEIIVVSGLPRSGTSLMMQMLTRGGVEAITDGLRSADDDNPAGYYEFEPVKKLKLNAAWLTDARGKAVKVISQLLFDLPASERYAVILMQRDLEEVLVSQDKMLARQGRTGADHGTMRSAFQSHSAKLSKWLTDQPHIRVLRINYPDLIAHSTAHADQISKFLGRSLTVEEMSAAVDPNLYRNRSS